MRFLGLIRSSAGPSASSSRMGLWSYRSVVNSQWHRIRRRFQYADLVVHSLILMLGIFQFLCYLRANDFWYDATYVELAKWILDKGRHVFSSNLETLYPPGFPLMLAIIGHFAGLTAAVTLRTMAISSTLALMATYEFLRRAEGRACGASACLLLGATWTMFTFGTRYVFSDIPYFAASAITLLMALWLDSESRSHRSFSFSPVLGAALVATLMMRSAGLALLVASCTWLGVSFLIGPKLGRRRLSFLGLPIVLGIVAQLAWAEWAGARQVVEWPVGGWPQPYTAQIMMKSGNEPDLGRAQLRDFPARIGRNLVSYAATFVELMEHKYVNPFWSSPAILGVLALLFIGLRSSIWPNGGELHDWYFGFYCAMYLVWPWDMEERFILPMIPLMALYVWRGVRACLKFPPLEPRITGLCCILCGLLLTVSSARVAVHDGRTHQRGAWQPLLATGLWSVITLAGTGLLLNNLRTRTMHLVISLNSETFLRRLRWIGAVAVVGLVSRGIMTQAMQARANLHFDVTKEPTFAEIEADKWIGQYEPQDRVVMARRIDLAFHYSGHRVIWFPPTANASVLMEGIQKYHVALIVVVDRPPDSYWRPADQACFQSLRVAYPSMFRLVHQGPGNRVFEVVASGSES